MSELTVSIPHQLTRAEARRRIQEQIALRRTVTGSLLGNLQETWTGDAMAFSLTALGQSITGHLVVEDQTVQLTVDLPWLLRMLGKAMLQKIEQQGRLLLGSSGSPARDERVR